jgi:acyl-CoA synthetase (AMP-forming)/AMP-acid ligase II
VRSRLAPYKVPKSYEFVAELARNEAGKLQRQKMVLARSIAPHSRE